MVVKIGSVVELKYLESGKIFKKKLIQKRVENKVISTPNYTQGRPTEESLAKEVSKPLEKDEISTSGIVGKTILGKRLNEVVKIRSQEGKQLVEIKIISVDNSQVDETYL